MKCSSGNRNHGLELSPGRLAAMLALATCSTIASAQFFSGPGAMGDWTTQQTALLIESPSGAVLCETPWNSVWTPSGVNLSISESLTPSSGGCQLVTLDRSCTLSTTVLPGASASIDLEFHIAAVATFEVDRYGTATGAMSGTGDGWFIVDRWCSADALIRFVADAGVSAATTALSGVFRGPMDPLTGEPVLVNEEWSGTTRETRTLEGILLAPGRYELHAEPSGSFLPIQVHQYTARVTASIGIDQPEASPPPAAYDLDGDGTVGLADACLWADAPTDADADGDTDQDDLELVMALARAGGSFAQDVDGDGRPDQCDGACVADFNLDGGIDFFDLLSFLETFSSGGTRADLNGDSVLDFFDLLAFLDAFSNGC